MENFNHLSYINKLIKNNKIDLKYDTFDDTPYVGSKKVDLSEYFSRNSHFNQYNGKMFKNHNLHFDKDMLDDAEKLQMIDYIIPQLVRPQDNGTVSYSFVGEELLDVLPDVDYMDALCRSNEELKAHRSRPRVAPQIHNDGSNTFVENTGGGNFSLYSVFSNIVDKAKGFNNYLTELIYPSAEFTGNNNIKPDDYIKVQKDINVKNEIFNSPAANNNIAVNSNGRNNIRSINKYQEDLLTRDINNLYNNSYIHRNASNVAANINNNSHNDAIYSSDLYHNKNRNNLHNSSNINTHFSPHNLAAIHNSFYTGAELPRGADKKFANNNIESVMKMNYNDTNNLGEYLLRTYDKHNDNALDNRLINRYIGADYHVDGLRGDNELYNHKKYNNIYANNNNCINHNVSSGNKYPADFNNYSGEMQLRSENINRAHNTNHDLRKSANNHYNKLQQTEEYSIYQPKIVDRHGYRDHNWRI